MDSPTPHFYANALDVAVSPYDLTLRFARNMPPAHGLGKSEASEEVLTPVRGGEIAVLTSPTHAKAILSALIVGLLRYEKDIGPVALPTEQTRKLQDALREATKSWT